jgi:putative transposase
MFSHFALHKEVYATIRDQFGLSAQMVVRCLAKVGDAYKLDRATVRRFKEHGSIAYDERILKYRTDKQVVSIWTLPGRQTIPYGWRPPARTA